jgi:hypothetical protein
VVFELDSGVCYLFKTSYLCQALRTDGVIGHGVRNCLSEASVKKLVYVRTNNLQFTKQQGVAAAFSNDDDITYRDAD